MNAPLPREFSAFQSENPEKCSPLTHSCHIVGKNTEAVIKQGEDTPMTAQLQGRVAGDTPATTRVTKGMAQGTPVLTADGIMPVEYLSPGDRIITRDGLRVLVDVSVHVMVGEVVRVCASSQGHAKPEEDVLLGVDQAILIRDWRAKALYGATQAVVPVERMVDGELVRRERVSGLRIYTLAFASAAVVYAGSLEVACEAVVNA
jgi:hypothetical protein